MNQDLRRSFRDLHVPGRPLLVPNPWDIGSARLFESLGFRGLATTSSGHASSLGRIDGQVTRDEALAYAAALAAATSLPITADLESGFGKTVDEVAKTYELACEAGLAGASIEDTSGDPSSPIRPLGEAVERVQAAVEVARTHGLVLTARADNYFNGHPDLADTIARLQAYQGAGADVLYAPGLTAASDIRAVVTSVDRPVNVLLRPTGPTVPELAKLGVARISVGGSFAFAAYGAAARAAREFLEDGTTSYSELSAVGHAATAGFRD